MSVNHKYSGLRDRILDAMMAASLKLVSERMRQNETLIVSRNGETVEISALELARQSGLNQEAITSTLEALKARRLAYSR